MTTPLPYDQDTGDLICERLASGESLRAICRSDALPAASTVFKWLNEHKDFAEQYARAREAQGEGDADYVNDIRDRVISGEIPPDVGRVAINACKWSSGKRLPKKYGDKIGLDVTSSDGAMQLLAESRRRAMQTAKDEA